MVQRRVCRLWTADGSLRHPVSVYRHHLEGVGAGLCQLIHASLGLGELVIDGVPRDTSPDPSFAGTLPGGPADGPVIDLTVHTDLGSLEVSRA